MITKKHWKQIKHFRPNERDHKRRRNAFGNLELLQFRVLWLLDQQTDFVKKVLYPDRKIYCIIHSGAGGIHSENSQHYLGLAVDVHYTSMSLSEQVMLSLMFPWNATAFYPTWNNQGLHLDLRKQKWYERRVMWYTYSIIENRKTIIKYENDKSKVISKIAILTT